MFLILTLGLFSTVTGQGNVVEIAARYIAVQVPIYRMRVFSDVKLSVNRTHVVRHSVNGTDVAIYS